MTTLPRESRPVTRRALLVASIIVGLGLAGCGGVLTDAHVAAANQFAEATKGFGTSPGTVITAYGDLRRERGLLESATRTDGKVAVGDLERALRQEGELGKLAASADTAIGVLDDYAQMLSLLSSSKFSEYLQNQTIALGGSIDNGIATFNKLAGANLQSFGDIVAGIVRGAGGIWIRYEQRKALVEAIKGAETPVAELTASIEKLMAFFLSPSGQGPFVRESEAVQGFLARPQPGAREFVVLERTQKAMQQAVNGQALAESCRRAAVEYRKAHEELVQAIVRGRGDLKSLVAQIQVLSQEIKAGKRVRDQVRKARNN